jgi:hypothetical protein
MKLEGECIMGKPYLKIIDTKLGIETNVNFNAEVGSSLANIDKALMNFKNKDSLAMELTKMGYSLPQEFDFKIKQDGKSFNVLYGDNVVVNYFVDNFLNPNYKPTKDHYLTAFTGRCISAIENKEFHKYLSGQLDPRFESNLLDAVGMHQESREYQSRNGLNAASHNFYREFNKYSVIRTFSEIVYNYNLKYGKNIDILTKSILDKQKNIKIDMFKTTFDVFHLTKKRKTKTKLKKVNHHYIENPVRKALDNPDLNKLDVWTLEQLQEFLPHDEIEELNDQIRDGRVR